MKEEIDKRSGEINDAALEQVSGGVTVLSSADVLKACEICPSRTDSLRYSCTYEGGDPQFLAKRMRRAMAEYCPTGFQPIFCPYLKKP